MLVVDRMAIATGLRTLVLASALDDQFNAVVGLVGSKTSVGSPVVAASVVDALDNGCDGLDIGRGTVEKDERDLALGVGLPCNCERLADGDDAVKTGLVDGVASRVTLGGSVGRDKRSKGSEAGGEESAERHYRIFLFFLLGMVYDVVV